MRSDLRILDRRYELSRRLGGGAMGEVWLGRDCRSGQAVAVKLVLRGTPTDPGQPEEPVQRFAREAEVLASLKHPGIPAFLDAQLNPEAGELYLVMEYILGRDLADIVGVDGRLPEPEVVSIAVQLCDILEYTHRIPVIHRDLKPANIMLTDDQQLVVLDFGVARTFSTRQAPLTQGGRVLGTVEYMPPEQCEGREVSTRSDLYSLACVLYRLLTGIAPFPGDDTAGIMYRHRYKTPEPVGLLCPGVDPRLAAVIMAGLAKQASNRPASAREFREGLDPLRREPGESGAFGGLALPTVARVPVPAGADRPPAELLPVAVRITQTQALFDDGLIVQALPRFADLAEELTGRGPEHAEDAAQCRFGRARCLTHLGYHEEALKLLQALAYELRSSRAPDDRLLLDVQFRIGQLRLDLSDQGGIRELAHVYRLLRAAERPADAAMLTDVRNALNRATLG